MMKSFLIAALGGFLLVHLTDGLTFSPDYPRPPRTSYGLVHVWSATLSGKMEDIQDDLHLWWDEHQSENTDKIDGKALVDEMIAELTKVLKLSHVDWYDKRTLDRMVWGMKSKGIPHFLKQMEDVMEQLEWVARPPPPISPDATRLPPMPNEPWNMWYH